MTYVVTALVVLAGLASSAIVETAAELSANELLDTDAGATLSSAPIAPDGIIDMRPEASFVLQVPGSR
jgi:hypothetical protein